MRVYIRNGTGEGSPWPGTTYDDVVLEWYLEIERPEQFWDIYDTVETAFHKAYAEAREREIAERRGGLTPSREIVVISRLNHDWTDAPSSAPLIEIRSEDA